MMEDSKNLHHSYFEQFLLKTAEDYVVRVIGRSRILTSKDPHMNDIPLDNWDCLQIQHYINKDMWREAHEHQEKGTYPWSKSDNVCLAKTAAKNFKMKHSESALIAESQSC
jgi:hypothetical protein